MWFCEMGLFVSRKYGSKPRPQAGKLGLIGGDRFLCFWSFN